MLRVLRLRGGALLVVAWILHGCGGDNGSGPTTPDATVSVDDDFFAPASVTVPPNGLVEWTWVGADRHNVVFTGGGASSPTQTTGTYRQTFASAGFFTYICTIHVNMTGDITVQ